MRILAGFRAGMDACTTLADLAAYRLKNQAAINAQLHGADRDTLRKFYQGCEEKLKRTATG